MPKNITIGTPVFHGDPPVSYLVIDIDKGKRTASIKSTAGAVVIHHAVAWAELTILDESQNAARIVRESTENK